MKGNNNSNNNNNDDDNNNNDVDNNNKPARAEKYQAEIWHGLASPQLWVKQYLPNMSSRNLRNSYRIARRAGQQGTRPSASGQAEVGKLATDLPSQPAVADNPTQVV